MRLRSLIAGGCLAGLLAAPALADSAEGEIRHALTQWVEDFNAGRADKVCAIYAPSLRGDVRGTPERDFDAHCKLLHEVLGDPARSFSLKLILKDVVAERDMAAVRLVWTITTKDKATGESSTAEKQGLDIFGRGSDGTWRILRFMNYEQP